MCIFNLHTKVILREITEYYSFIKDIIESHSFVMNRKMKMQIIHYNWHKILPKIVVHNYVFLQIIGKY